jgi:hypothetical protein
MFVLLELTEDSSQGKQNRLGEIDSIRNSSTQKHLSNFGESGGNFLKQSVSKPWTRHADRRELPNLQTSDSRPASICYMPRNQGPIRLPQGTRSAGRDLPSAGDLLEPMVYATDRRHER